ncbi:DEAD/DEAH box helicase [Hansschlegelia sp.]|uniref:DEAD/DEAH box helicase n=1 Tax=Hansschlegelia sp. TaxID=2041892 RepID=UPI002CB60E85|nr:DEAD/DEAH box helicase [Hansschlegelia sp.]HVI30441.1 DEAD/DEAH box helicase [Hansschlegelia sp.]
MAIARPLRPHQVKALDLIRSAVLDGSFRPLLQLATGGGKTRLAAEIVERARVKGNRVVFVVPALSLIDQTVKAFIEEGIPAHEIGVIQADHPMTAPHRPIQVASVQTLERRLLPITDVVIIDEAHRWFRLYARWMAADGWQRKPFIGLSATPWAKGLGKHFDRLLIAATTQELIEAGFLSPFRVFAPSHPDLSGVRTVAGDYHEGDLSKAMDRPDLVADVVRTWLMRADRRPTLCFAVDRAHAKTLQRQFTEAGVSCGYVDAYTGPDEREDVRKAFHSREIEVVCNVGVLTTGVDWDVRCIILARPTKSEMLYVQIVGRGLRTAEGKTDCLILDHSDTTLRLGFVTDIHHPELDLGDGRRKQERDRRSPLPKECAKCTFLKPARVHVCPVCGFAPERQSGVTCDAGGALFELNGGGKRRKPTPQEKATWYAMLLGYAERHGKTTAWALANYREKFLEWPFRKNDVRPWPPSDEVYGWVKSRAIAYAKGKQKGEGRHAA